MRHMSATMTTATVHDQSLGEKVANALSQGLGCLPAVATLPMSDEPVQHPAPLHPPREPNALPMNRCESALSHSFAPTTFSSTRPCESTSTVSGI